MFETLVRARATTKKIETADDLEDFTTLEDPEKEEIRQLLKGVLEVYKLHVICNYCCVSFDYTI